MYRSHWGLTEKPFENTPDPRFLYLSTEHEEGLSRLHYAVREGKGAGMLTGVFGCGKTLLTRALLRDLDSSKYRIGVVRDPQVSATELLRLAAHAFGAEDPPVQKPDLLMLMERILTRNMEDGKDSVLIIDDAHAIPDEMAFEQVWLLLNFQLERRFMLTVLLVGQPQLRSKVDAIKQLVQRIAIGYHLGPLDEEETGEYIRHRLGVVSDREGIFTDEAVKLVFRDSGGIPRRINQICDMSLFTGYGRSAAAVDEVIVREAVESLGV